jgi:hypothetical protein
MIMKIIIELSVFGALMLFMSACVGVDGGRGGGGGWQQIAVTEADFRNDRDTVNIPPGEGQYRQLRLVVSGGDLEMRDMIIHFANGETYRPNIRHAFSNEGPPLVIDFPGNVRNVTRIEYNYRSTNKREGKARVMVYGR